MSMLTSMCEKMRITADEVERIKNNNADWLWRDGITLMDAVMEMHDAADVIDGLRGMYQDVQFENERLRNAIQVMYDLLLSGKVEPCDLCDMLGTCENHPAPPPCKYDRAEEALMDWLKGQGIEVEE